MKGILTGKKILLTGAGGPAISGMIGLLREAGAYIVAVDMLNYSPGFYLADKSYIVPAGDSKNFLPVITKICKSENIDGVVSVVDEELTKVGELEQIGIPVIQPNINFIKFILVTSQK